MYYKLIYYKKQGNKLNVLKKIIWSVLYSIENLFFLTTTNVNKYKTVFCYSRM